MKIGTLTSMKMSLRTLLGTGYNSTIHPLYSRVGPSRHYYYSSFSAVTSDEDRTVSKSMCTHIKCHSLSFCLHIRHPLAWHEALVKVLIDTLPIELLDRMQKSEFILIFIILNGIAVLKYSSTVFHVGVIVV